MLTLSLGEVPLVLVLSIQDYPDSLLTTLFCHFSVFFS